MSDQSVSGQARRAAGYATLALNLERERNSLQREVAELKEKNAKLKLSKEAYERDAVSLLQISKGAADALEQAGKENDELRAAKEAAEQRCAELAKALRAMVDRWEPDSAGADRRMWETAVAALAASPQGSSPAGAGQQEPKA